MRVSLSVVAIIAFAAPLCAEEPLTNLPLYQSVEDPEGQRPTRILAEGGVLHFGNEGSERHDLLRSDLGTTMYFIRVDGGVRVRGQPILFPEGASNRFQFEDFSCSTVKFGTTDDVLCRKKSDGQLFRSTVVDGGLVSFDLRCFDKLDSVCHYRLIDGRPIRPNSIAER